MWRAAGRGARDLWRPEAEQAGRSDLRARHPERFCAWVASEDDGRAMPECLLGCGYGLAWKLATASETRSARP